MTHLKHCSKAPRSILTILNPPPLFFFLIYINSLLAFSLKWSEWVNPLCSESSSWFMEFGTLHLSNKKHKNNWRCSAKAAVFPNRELSLCQCCKLAAASCLWCMYDVWITQISYLTSCNIKFVGWEPEKPGRLKLPQGQQLNSGVPVCCPMLKVFFSVQKR